MRNRGSEAVWTPIYEDNHLLAADKPAGLPSQPDASGDASLVEAAKEYLRVKCDKRGNIYLALLHRLDRPTSGVVLLARTDKAAGRMAEQFRRRKVDRTYLALVECAGRPADSVRLENLLLPSGNGGMKVAREGSSGAKQARLTYRALAFSGDETRALLEVNLETGVKHQIRCQLAHAGLPVAGDFRYGPFGRPAHPVPVNSGKAILLHAWRVGFVHPVRKEAVSVSAPLPGHWDEHMAAFPAELPGMLENRNSP